MVRSLVNDLRTVARWGLFALLLVTIAEPTIWQPAWWFIESTGTALGDHADRLSYELNWRLMNGAM